MTDTKSSVYNATINIRNTLKYNKVYSAFPLFILDRLYYCVGVWNTNVHIVTKTFDKNTEQASCAKCMYK